MKKILLVCSAGMSTSMLVKKIQEAADKKNIEAKVWAVGDAVAEENIRESDIVLLGPQVRFLLEKIKGYAKEKPVMVIDMAAYGTMNGMMVLEMALKELGE